MLKDSHCLQGFLYFLISLMHRMVLLKYFKFFKQSGWFSMWSTQSQIMLCGYGCRCEGGWVIQIRLALISTLVLQPLTRLGSMNQPVHLHSDKFIDCLRFKSVQLAGSPMVCPSHWTSIHAGCSGFLMGKGKCLKGNAMSKQHSCPDHQLFTDNTESKVGN